MWTPPALTACLAQVHTHPLWRTMRHKDLACRPPWIHKLHPPKCAHIRCDVWRGTWVQQTPRTQWDPHFRTRVSPLQRVRLCVHNHLCIRGWENKHRGWWWSKEKRSCVASGFINIWSHDRAFVFNNPKRAMWLTDGIVPQEHLRKNAQI
jgi:hypothetical protein